MQGNTKTIDPSSDLCGAVASLSSGDTLILKPGVYKIARHIVVDKDVVIKGSTGAAKDAVIIREGSTAAVIAGGSPTFENLTFVSPGGNADAGQDSISYESCVAVRGGSPTFIGCRATSAEQSGYSVRGEGVAAKLVRCEARGTCHGGIFFDGRATGLLEECLFADNGLGCVDVEDTADGKWVEIRKCRLIKSGFASLSTSRTIPTALKSMTPDRRSKRVLFSSGVCFRPSRATKRISFRWESPRLKRRFGSSIPRLRISRSPSLSTRRP